MKALIGTKLGMTSIISENGRAIGVTIIQAAPNKVTLVKTLDSDGYDAIQLGVGDSKRSNKPQSKLPSKLKEFRQKGELNPGDDLDVSVFSEGDKVKVTATSKGKGFAGTIKRHNFMRHKKTHGGKGNTRRPGSIGSMYPQKVFKGKKMAGRMGGQQTSTRNLEVVFIDSDNNLLGLRGSVPGPAKSTVTVVGL